MSDQPWATYDDPWDDDQAPWHDGSDEELPTLRTRIPTSPLAALYRILLNQQLTTGRLALAGVLGGVAMLVAVLIAANTSADRTQIVIGFLSAFGLGLSIPIVSLVLGSSALGQLTEDQTLVYLWLRPNPRWMLALSAAAAAATVTVPMATVPLALAALVGTGDLGAVAAVTLAGALAALAYTALFTLVGLMLKRALIWGLVYVFIWELFVARVGQGAARLSINTYPLSVLARLTDTDLPQADRSMASGLLVPLVAAAVAVLATAWRLDRADVD